MSTRHLKHLKMGNSSKNLLVMIVGGPNVELYLDGVVTLENRGTTVQNGHQEGQQLDAQPDAGVQDEQTNRNLGSMHQQCGDRAIVEYESSVRHRPPSITLHVAERILHRHVVEINYQVPCLAG